MYPRFSYSKDKAPDLKKIIEDFHNALNEKDVSVVQQLWFQHYLVLSNWYAGRKMNFGSAKAPQWSAISEQESITDFKLALSIPFHEVSNYLWFNNPIIADWFGRKHVLKDMSQNDVMNAIISTRTAIEYFHLALVSKNQSLITAMWASNSSLKIWYTRTYRKNSSQGIPHVEFHRDFNLVLQCNCPEVLDALWNSHAFPHAWFSGSEINLGTSNQPDRRTISEVEIIRCFRGMLTTKNTRAIEGLWLTHKELLRKHYLENATISIEDLISDFKAAVVNGHAACAKEIWNNNIPLQFWFSGLSYSFGTIQSEVTSLNGALFLFNEVIKSKNDELALGMWDKSPLLRNWYRGGNTNTAEQLSCSIKPAELINFLSAVEENGNTRTAAAIKKDNQFLIHVKKAPGIEREAKVFSDRGDTYSMFSSSVQIRVLDNGATQSASVNSGFGSNV